MSGIKMNFKYNNLSFARESYKQGRFMLRISQTGLSDNIVERNITGYSIRDNKYRKILKGYYTELPADRANWIKEEILNKNGIKRISTIERRVNEGNIKKLNSRKYYREIVRRLSSDWKKNFISKQVFKEFYGVDREKKLGDNLEKRLDVILFRLGWTRSLKESRDWITQGQILISEGSGPRPTNRKHIKMNVKEGMIIKVSKNKIESKLMNKYLNKKFIGEKPEWLLENKESCIIKGSNISTWKLPWTIS